MKTKRLSKEEEQDLRTNEKKWSAKLMEAGWTAVPSVILERQQALGLDPVDINIILQLASYWWFPDRLPYPSKKALAERIGVSESTIRRHVAALESHGLLKREPQIDPKTGAQLTNVYRLDGLIQMATPFAEEAISRKKKRKKEDTEVSKRKRPILTIVD